MSEPKQLNPCKECGTWLWGDPRPCWNCARIRSQKPSSPAGVDNALKMRQMFVSSGYKCYFECHPPIKFVRPTAVLSIKKDGYFACFYFNEDGTYYRGPN